MVRSPAIRRIMTLGSRIVRPQNFDEDRPMATESLQPSIDPKDDLGVAGNDLPPILGDPLSLPSIAVQERALPIRPGDLTRLLKAQPGLDAEARKHLGQFAQILGAIFHSEFYGKLRNLKELYSPLDPDSDHVAFPEHSRKLTATSDEEFLPPFEATMEKANYRKLDVKAIEDAVAAPNELGLTYVPDFTLFEHLRIFVRGYTKISRVFRSPQTRFRKRTIVLDAYQRLVIVLKFKDGLDLGPFVRTDVIYLRMFKDVPHVDMEMHLPEQGTRVKMRTIDKMQIASPVAVGLPTLAIKALGLSIGAASMNPMLLAPLVIAPVTAGLNSFFGFQRAKHKHLSSMIRNLYYLTMANNGSVLTRLIDSAEEEEFKETMLAYFFLWRSIGEGNDEGWTSKQLDRHIEAFLKEVSGVDVDFEIKDAVAKLARLGLARRDARGRLHGVPIEEALAGLDRMWDNTFRFA